MAAWAKSWAPACAVLILSGAVAPSASARVGPHARPEAPSTTDIEGLWTNASYTRLQRPKKLKSLVMTPDEAKVYEATLTKYHGVPSNPMDHLGQNDSEFPDSGEGLAKIRGQLRTSWIVSPADGRVPYTAEAKARLHIGDPDFEESFDNPEDRPDGERCISSNGDSPPQMSEQDANLVQIVRTKDHVAIYSEKNHEFRIIPLTTVRTPNQPPSWAGNSIGRFEGATLVVETQGFRREVMDRDFFFHSGDAKVTERFTRTGPGELLYEFTVVDPKTFTQPLRGEELFRATKGPIYEYTCHEGNYSLPSIMKAARLGRQVKPPKKAPAAVATAEAKPAP
ncbi:hypothetical protein BH09PSE2_BH09PSE2_18110 [soil metagenome]